MQVKERPLEDFIQLIRGGRPGAYSRWGDGEWKSIFGMTRGFDRDGHSYFPQLAVDLRAVLDARPPYSLGLPKEVQDLYGDNVGLWIERRGLLDLDWVEADALQEAARTGNLSNLIEALRDAPALVVVGPPRLANLKQLLGYREFVCVPPRNCYLALKSMLRETFAASEHLPVGSVISISAGMPAKLLVHELYKRFSSRHLILDFGSTWDAVAAVPPGRRQFKE